MLLAHLCLMSPVASSWLCGYVLAFVCQWQHVLQAFSQHVTGRVWPICICLMLGACMVDVFQGMVRDVTAVETSWLNLQEGIAHICSVSLSGHGV